MIDVATCLKRFKTEESEGKQLAHEFLSEGTAIPRYVLGCNEQSRKCIERVKIDGIVDDFALPGAMWNGVPVTRADALPPGAVVINCSMSIRPLSAHVRLKKLQGVRVLAYWHLMQADEEFALPDFVASFREDVALNGSKWQALEDRLADEQSKQILEAVMRFRLTGDYRYMTAFSVRFNEQYFDWPAPLSNAEVFVDCGGFDGDTVLEFCARNPIYKHIYLFEPSPANFAKARARLEGIPNITLFRVGVSSAQGKLFFDPDAGSASAVSMSGSAHIDVVTIDECISERVTFIKMDLEGWELEALQGAKRHIAEDHPKLAISAYHRASDFWRIPESIFRIRNDYDVLLRHYSEGWSETVMYFVPRQLD